jgi:hypothetical protein
MIHVVHHRAFFDLGHSRTRRALGHLLDNQLEDWPAAMVVQDPDVFEADQGLDDLSRVDEDEGASCFLAHNLKLGAPSPNSVAPELVLLCSPKAIRTRVATLGERSGRSIEF